MSFCRGGYHPPEYNLPVTAWADNIRPYRMFPVIHDNDVNLNRPDRDTINYEL